MKITESFLNINASTDMGINMNAETNLSIWEQVCETDDQYTKDIGTSGLTAINPTYLIKQATELWGPFGDKWGAKVVKDITQAGSMIYIFEEGKRVAMEPNQNHTIEIEFFYPGDDGKPIKFNTYGHTPYIYLAYDLSNIPYVHTDFEVKKKSFTDALKKALSMLGFAADVHMGMFEVDGYRESIRTKKEIENSIDQAKVTGEKLAEFEEWLEKELKTYPGIKSKSVLEKVFNKHKQEISLKCKGLGIDHEPYLKKAAKVFQSSIDK